MPYPETAAIFSAFRRRSGSQRGLTRHGRSQCWQQRPLFLFERFTHAARVILRFGLSLSLLAASAWLLPSAEAQSASNASADQSGSHRRLPLPSNGTPDLKQQMFLMKQLQSMLSGQSVPPNGQSAESNSTSGNPQQDRITDALKSLKDKLPPELRPMLDNVPPALVEQAMSDPAIKEQMKQVLEEYSKSRQLPQGNSPNGSRLPLPPNGSPSSRPPTSRPPSSDGSESKSAEPQGAERPKSPNSEPRDSQPQSTNPSPTPNSQRPNSQRPRGSSSQSQAQPRSGREDSSDADNRPNGDQNGAAEPRADTDSAQQPNEAAESAFQKLRELWNRQLGRNSETSPGSGPPAGNGTADDSDAAQNQLPSSGNGRSSNRVPQNSARPPNSSQQPNSSEKRPRSSQRSSSEQPNPADIADGSQSGDKADDWGRRLENLIRQQRGEPPLPEPPLPEPPLPEPLLPEPPLPEPLLPEPRAGSSQGGVRGAASGERGRDSDTADITQRSGGKPSVAEFLEMMQGMVPEDTASPSDRDSGRPNATGSASGDGSDAESGAEERERLAEQIRRKQQDAKENLQQLGLQETLKKIVKGAQKEAREQQIAAQQNSATPEQDGGSESSADDSSEGKVSGGMSESMLRALGGISRDLIEIVKDARFKPADDQQRGRSGNAARAEPAQPSAARSMLNELRDTTTELLADIGESPADRPTTAEDQSSANQADKTSLSDLIAQWLLPILLVSVLLMLFLWRSGVIAPPGGAGAAAMSQVRAQDVQSKADVIRAFHRMALHPARATQHWWTHQMVADDIREASPDKDEQVRILTRLYEQARYLPEDADFTVEQISEAQAALKRCET